MNKRLAWIDIAKGLGIIAVVISHFAPKGTTFYQSIYWWHMPLFFMIGGFFVKPLTRRALPHYLKTKIWPQLKQYFAYGLALITVSFFVEQHTVTFSLRYVARLLYGGTFLNGYLSAFWFMTVYLASLVLFSLIKGYVSSVAIQAGIMLVLFGLGTSYPNATAIFGFPLPGNLDLVLLAMPYMFIGWWFFHYARPLIHWHWLGLAALGLFVLLYILQASGQLNFLLFMKSHHLTDPLLALLVPPALALGIFVLAQALSHISLSRGLVALGRATVPIMYLHKAVGYSLEKFIPPHLVLWVVAGVLLPYCMLRLWQYVTVHWSTDEKYATD